MSFLRVLSTSVLLCSSFLFLTGQSVNWYHDSKTNGNVQNIGTDELYEKILKNRKGVPVIVAVIDSGIDIEHEDLKDNIWTNPGEIPNNNIDDDKNGYVDDVHGWNFIGGKDGSQVDGDTYEMVRQYALLKEKYNDVNPATLNAQQLKEFNQFNDWGTKIEAELKGAKENYEELMNRKDLLMQAISVVETVEDWSAINQAFVDSLGQSFDQDEVIAGNILNYFLNSYEQLPSYEEIKEELSDQLSDGLKYYGNRFKYNYNVDYDPRSIVGDDYSNKQERYYGNNSVEGPDAFHGTHVAGIIAAMRNNELGINGIADNVKIMVLRAVPDGDERDKDVANAILYAVENGAQVINMSFGKGISPEKDIVDNAIRFAEKNDVLIVHAAGNSSQDIDVEENYPNDTFRKPKKFLFWKKKQAKNYISVGASGPSANEALAAPFSNYGKKNVDLFAPGEEMFSTIPNNDYKIAQGTSMAAPVVSGVAAILRSYYPSLTATQIKEVLMGSCSPVTLMVKKPGTSELISFKELSVSGGVVDIVAAMKMANQIKGKKKASSRTDIRA